MIATIPCPYCGLALALLISAPFIVKHHCPLTKTWQSGCVRPLEEGGTWFLRLRDQVHLTAENTQRTGHVAILTGRWNDDGSPEALIRAYALDDLQAMARLDGYAHHVMRDRA